MASSWITKRKTAGGVRYRVMWRSGGRESIPRYGGSFRTLREAHARRTWVVGELAAMRLPDLSLLRQVEQPPTVAEVAARWQESRVDVAENTRLQHRSAVRRALPALGDRRIDTVTASDIADLVAKLAAAGKARASIAKTVTALAMIFDHAEINPNPARDRLKVRLPRQERAEVNPPTAEHVLAVHRVLPERYRLPLLVLDGTGMRLGELEKLTWGDVDVSRGRWRVSAAVSKTRAGRWVNVPPTLFGAVCDLVAREDRTPERRVFQGFGADRFRTAITRACTATGVPAFSHTTSAIAGSASCISAAFLGRGSASTSGSGTWPSRRTPTRMS